MPPVAPPEEGDEDVAMALEVGIVNDDDIMPDATVEEDLRGDDDVLSATAGAIEPSVLLEEAVDLGSPPRDSSVHSSPQLNLAALSIGSPTWGFGDS